MVPCQARFRYAYNPENNCDSYRDPSKAASKQLSNSANHNFAPTPNSFSALAHLEETPVTSPRRSKFWTPKSEPPWRCKQARVRYKSREEGTERAQLLQVESIGKWCQRLARSPIERAGSPTTEDQDNANYIRHSASLPFRFVGYVSSWLNSSPIGPVLSQRISLAARTNFEASNKMVRPALHPETTSERLSTSICLSKITLSSRTSTLNIDALGKRGSKAPWHTPISTQEPAMNHLLTCAAKDAVAAILSRSPFRSKESDRYSESFYQDMSTPLTCQHCRFPRSCHTAHFSATRVMPHHEGLTNTAFAYIQFSTGWAKCDNFSTYKSPIPLLEPLSSFYSHELGHLYKSSWVAGIAYCYRTLSNSALMESLNQIRPIPTDALFIHAQQNCKAIDERSAFLSHTFGYSIPHTDNTHIRRLKAMPTPKLMINGYRKSSLAQQVDSIFANRNPRMRRRLYSGSTKSARYPWFENGFETPSVNLESASISPPREEPHTYSRDPSGDSEPGREWVRISRQNSKRSYLSILSEIWHQRTSMSIDSILPFLYPISDTIEEPAHSVESNLDPYSFEIMEDIDKDSDLESNGEYEVLESNADDSSLEEWEAISPLSASTSYYGSDDDSLWEEHCEAGL